jgi:hypothetical protein
MPVLPKNLYFMVFTHFFEIMRVPHIDVPLEQKILRYIETVLVIGF